MMEPQALSFIGFLLALGALVHGIEFILLRPVFADNGVWRWSSLQSELMGGNRWLSSVTSLIFGSSGFAVLNGVRILAALLLIVFPQASIAFLLLGIHVLTILRWLGTFNGGSDYMTLLLWVAFSVALAARSYPNIVTAMLWYISVQLCLSYFKAGYYKVKNSLWRNGTALQGFLQSSIYEPKPIVRFWASSPSRMKWSAWLILIFELTFPVSLLNPYAALSYITLGIVFHLANVYLFGLNRFLWAWMAAYPALFYCAAHARLLEFGLDLL